MLFQVCGENALFQWLGWVMVFLGLIVLNEVARRSKIGGIFMFGALPIAMTFYCIIVTAGAAGGAAWAVNNPTVLFQNGWFHYAKVYAALTGCIGFMILKYHWGRLGKSQMFKCFPFVIVAINILIAVVSDFESAVHFFTGTISCSTARPCGSPPSTPRRYAGGTTCSTVRPACSTSSA